jgi:hypothetical protein
MSYRGQTEQSSSSALIIRHTGQVFPLTQAPVSIGRQADNAIVLADPQASRRHAVISWQAGTFVVQDSGSANGTFVNNRLITGPQPLRDGDVLRVGNTLFDVRLGPSAGDRDRTIAASALPPSQTAGTGRRSNLPIIIGLLLAGIVVVGLAIAAILLLSGGQKSTATVAIQSPAQGTEIASGSEIIVQATAAGARDITRLELRVDDVLVGVSTSPDSQGTASLTASKPWTFDQVGPHVISAVAYTAGEGAQRASEVSTSVEVSVVEAAAQVTPTATGTPEPANLPDLFVSDIRVELETGGACDYVSTQLGTRVWITNNGGGNAGTFVVDVNGVQQTVGGLAAGQTTSLWYAGYAIGSPTTVILDPDNQIQESNKDNNTLSQMLPIPTLPPTCTPPLPDEPTYTPTPTPSDTPTSTHTPTPTPTPTPTQYPPPEISFFQANPSIIVAGECTDLEWGAVTNATAATIDQGIGGVATPGSRNVCPASTTTYVLTATGVGGTTTASATVTVQAAEPDLSVESIVFAPMPPVQNQDNEVRITLRNVGPGPAGPFHWEWQPGSAAPLGGHVPGGLNAGQSLVVTAIWHPGSWYANLPTVARVDVGNAVAESDETNNELQMNVQVVPPLDVTVTLQSQAMLDGFQANNGGGNNAVDIRLGNGAMVGSPPYELVIRGFMSFDLSGIPAGATVHSIELRFYQVQVSGNPYGKLGNPLLNHVDYGSSLNQSAYDTPAMHSAILSPHTSPGDWYTITSGVIADWIEQDLAAGRSRLQMRLQFATETDGDGSQDTVSFESGNNYFGTGNIPQLTINYTP